MAILKGKELARAFSPEQLKELGFSQETDFEIQKIRAGVWVISEKESAEQKKTIVLEKDIKKIEIEAKIFSMLQEKKLSDRVEGKFEKLLSQEELLRFKELLKEGKVFAFKLSDKYKKPIYKISFAKEKETEKIAMQKKTLEEHCLEKDGVLVCTNANKARQVSFEMQDAIKKGEILGIKSFDGNYYVIENELLQKYRQPVAEIIQANKNMQIAEISKKLGISEILAKIVCEFLKEDGEIIEKKKEFYQYVT